MCKTGLFIFPPFVDEQHDVADSHEANGPVKRLLKTSAAADVWRWKVHQW